MANGNGGRSNVRLTRFGELIKFAFSIQLLHYIVTSLLNFSQQNESLPLFCNGGCLQYNCKKGKGLGGWCCSYRELMAPPPTYHPLSQVCPVTQWLQWLSHGGLLLYISCLFLELQFPHSPRQSQHGIDRVFETGERLLNKSFGYIGREIASYTK